MQRCVRRHRYDGYGEAFMWYSHNLIGDTTYAGLMRYCGYADVARAVAMEQQQCVHRSIRNAVRRMK